MYDRPPIVALRDTLATLAAKPRPFLVETVDQHELRRQVSAVVDDCKRRGWQPEQVIVAIKTIARDAGLPEPRVGVSTPTRPLRDEEAVIVDLVRWCIETYYNVDWPPVRDDRDAKK